MVAAGERGTDLAVRLGYAGVEHTLVHDTVEAIASCPPGHVEVVANYTAFLQLNRMLERRCADSTVRIGLVLPDVMGTYGDGGNAVVLRQRLRLRGIDAEIVEITLDDPVPSTPGPVHARRRRGLRAAAGDQAPHPVSRVCRRRRRRGAPVLAICAAIQVLGHWYETSAGERVDGVGLLDVTTSPQPKRTIGEVVSQPLLDRSHRTADRLRKPPRRNGSGLAALSRWRAVTKGAGNRAGDGIDGAVQGSVVATYLHGPCLARNPELADHLLSRVVGDLAPLELPEVDLLRRERLAAPRRV